MRSHSFQELELEYSLKAREEDSRNSFRIDPATGMITLRKKLKHITDRRTYNVVVTVSEKISRLTSQVEVKQHLNLSSLNLLLSSSSTTSRELLSQFSTYSE